MKKLYRSYQLCLILFSIPLVIFFAFAFCFNSFTPHVKKKDTWIDEDGSAAIHIGDNSISIHTMTNFYWFKKIFDKAASPGKIRLCIGPDDGYGIAQNCFEHLSITRMSFSSCSKGQTHSLIFDSKNNEVSFTPFKQILDNGNTIKVSIDDYDIFASYSLHENYELEKQYTTRLTWIE